MLNVMSCWLCFFVRLTLVTFPSEIYPWENMILHFSKMIEILFEQFKKRLGYFLKKIILHLPGIGFV